MVVADDLLRADSPVGSGWVPWAGSPAPWQALLVVVFGRVCEEWPSVCRLLRFLRLVARRCALRESGCRQAAALSEVVEVGTCARVVSVTRFALAPEQRSHGSPLLHPKVLSAVLVLLDSVVNPCISPPPPSPLVPT